MGLHILQSGLLATVQDLGRTGFRQLGINPTGAMDTLAASLVNSLVGNSIGEGVIEFHFPMGELLFEQDAVVALGGADFQLVANGKPLENWQPYYLLAGTKIVSGSRQKGARLYMAVQNGFAINQWLGSVSTHLKAHAGGFQGRSLQKGDVIPFRNTIATTVKTLPKPNSVFRFPWKISSFVLNSFYQCTCIRILVGPEWKMLTTEAQEMVTTGNFQITPRSDRMGYRLNGKTLAKSDLSELISSAVTKGTIQLLPDGQLIILMADHQTTGGYPRIGTVIAADLPALAQLSAGEFVRFRVVSIEDAEADWLEQLKLQHIIQFAVSDHLQKYFL